jgi:preprotein translocase subunit SecE
VQATQKIVNLGLLLTAGCVFAFMVNLTQALWSLAGLPRMVDWLVAPAQLISFGMTVGAGIYIRQNAAANQFLNEVVQELSKVTWPTRKETVMSTGVACILVVICAAVLLLFDTLWGTVLRGIFN